MTPHLLLPLRNPPPTCPGRSREQWPGAVWQHRHPSTRRCSTFHLRAWPHRASHTCGLTPSMARRHLSCRFVGCSVLGVAGRLVGHSLTMPCVSLSVCLSACLPACLPVCLSVCPSCLCQPLVVGSGSTAGGPASGLSYTSSTAPMNSVPLPATMGFSQFAHHAHPTAGRGRGAGAGAIYPSAGVGVGAGGGATGMAHNHNGLRPHMGHDGGMHAIGGVKIVTGPSRGGGGGGRGDKSSWSGATLLALCMGAVGVGQPW